MCFNTMKKKRIFVHKCDWCNEELILNGKDSDSYVVTAEYKYFCIIQTPGKPAERDCLKNYLENKKKKNEYPIKKKLEEKKEKEEQEKEEKEKRLEAAPRISKLADDFLAGLKQREFKRRLNQS